MSVKSRLALSVPSGRTMGFLSRILCAALGSPDCRTAMATFLWRSGRRDFQSTPARLMTVFMGSHTRVSMIDHARNDYLILPRPNDPKNPASGLHSRQIGVDTRVEHRHRGLVV